MNEFIYLDHSATTAIDESVATVMSSYLNSSYKFGNPGRSHWAGAPAKQAIEYAKQQTANLINAHAGEIVFTSGATESVNHVVKGIAFAYLSHPNKNQIVTSSIEHPSTSSSCQFLQEHLAIKVKIIPVDSYGVIDLDFAKTIINSGTSLLSIIFSSHEVGTIQPIKELISMAQAQGVITHIDATCTVGKLPVDVQELDCDFLSFSAHKLYGPKGVGALYIKKSIQVDGLPGADNLSFAPLIHGSGGKGVFRSGTPNVMGIVGMGKACQIANSWNTTQNRQTLNNLSRYFLGQLENALGDKVTFNGHPDPKYRVCNILNVSFKGYTGEELLAKLDKIAASSGPKTEHVLTQMGKNQKLAKGGIRFSLGKHTNKKQIDMAVAHIQKIYAL